jgi:hypothetical protein
MDEDRRQQSYDAKVRNTPCIIHVENRKIAANERAGGAANNPRSRELCDPGNESK